MELKKIFENEKVKNHFKYYYLVKIIDILKIQKSNIFAIL